MKQKIILILVSDEEIGGLLGMKLFVKHEEFKKLNIGISLDEGISPDAQSYFYCLMKMIHRHYIITNRSVCLNFGNELKVGRFPNGVKN